MVNQGVLIVFTMILALLVGAAAISGPIAKPGCRDSCGNVSIPYPFGTTEECYFDKEFLITCSQALDPPKAFLTGSPIKVTKITLEGKLTIMQHISRSCYNNTGGLVKRIQLVLTLSKFIISDTDNKFIAVGCDTQGYIQSYHHDQSLRNMAGCMSMCHSVGHVVNGSCSGVGCCQTSIAEGLNYFDVAVGSFNNHTDVWNFSSCSYAFVVEDNQFNFTWNYLRDLENINEVPLVLDWSIGNETCTEVEEKTMRNACKGKSTCYDVENGFGYLCKCLEGYEGNPYLPDGCQDTSFIGFF